MGARDLLYTKEHEWVRLSGEKAIIGVTDYAQHELGDVVFVDLPSVDDEFAAGDGIAVIESVKAVSDVYAPVSGRVIAVNERLEDSPELINEDPYGDGWIVEIELADTNEVNDLLTEETYKKLIEEE